MNWQEMGGDGLTVLTSDDGLMVYECVDGTWRVLFEHGHETSEMDDKIRNLKSREEAISRAEAWHKEWKEQP